MYRVKSLPEFYDRFMEREKYKYGAKLEFVHTKEKFAKEDQKLLDFVLKYSEIVKYANESSTGYDYYTKRIGEDAIIISNTGLDDLFDCLENRVVQVENQYSTDEILFVNKEPEIKFNLEQVNINEYKITTNADVYDYMVYDGRRYEYVLIGKKLYRCSKKYRNTVIKLLDIFRKNFTKEIILPTKELSNFFVTSFCSSFRLFVYSSRLSILYIHVPYFQSVFLFRKKYTVPTAIFYSGFGNGIFFSII